MPHGVAPGVAERGSFAGFDALSAHRTYRVKALGTVVNAFRDGFLVPGLLVFGSEISRLLYPPKPKTKN